MKETQILLVDDEVIFTRNLSKLLEVRGYEVTIANDGKSALRAFDEKKFDVVVLDLKMPGMDGIATLEEIKNLGLFTETLILTGHGSSETKAKAAELGAYAYMNKPCDLDDLLGMIKKASKKKSYTEKREDLDKLIRT
ncbi:MAG: response regulator [Desulfobacteraceae bacterium]|jgi:DNA-binding NtrC family response regulator|nr:response regulator [Desulfobacteraceae bacterium]